MATEAKQWIKVVQALAGIETSSKPQMSLEELKVESNKHYLRHLDYVMQNNSTDITVGEDALVPPFPASISREEMERGGNDTWRHFREVKKVINNEIQPEFLSLLNVDGKIPSGNLMEHDRCMCMYQ